MANTAGATLGAVAEVVKREDRWHSNLLAEFESALNTKLRRAEARLLATVAQKMALNGAEQIIRNAGNATVVRSLQISFEKELAREGYGTLVNAFVGQFPHQFTFFEETLSLLKLPKIDWGAKDLAVFERQQLASAEALQSVVTSVAETARRKAMLSIGGMRMRDMAVMMSEEWGKTLPQATGIADTAISIFHATLTAQGFASYVEAGYPVVFKYYGPQDDLNRPFCAKLLAANKTYTADEIARMDNGQIPNVMVSRGGWKCRHQWLLWMAGITDQLA